jgi:hypothetical protein
MVATYDRHEIRFAYPDNWELSEEYQGSDSHCVTLQSPGSAFWMLQAVAAPKSIERLATESLRSVKQEYGDVEVVRVQEEIEGTPSIGYDLYFYCLDLLVSSQIRCFTLNNRSCVLLCQAEDTEFDRTRPVFAAITASLFGAGLRR